MAKRLTASGAAAAAEEAACPEPRALAGGGAVTLCGWCIIKKMENEAHRSVVVCFCSTAPAIVASVARRRQPHPLTRQKRVKNKTQCTLAARALASNSSAKALLPMAR